MAFNKPESLEGLDLAALATLRGEAVAAARSVDDDDRSPETTAMLEGLLDAIVEIDARSDALNAEGASADAARTRLAELAPVVEEPAAEAGEAAVEDAAEEPAEELEPVAAAASARPTSAVRQAASVTPAPVVHKAKAPVVPLTVITAAANVPDFTAGQNLGDMAEVAQAFLGRVGSFGGQNDPSMKPGVYQMTPNASRNAVARFRRKDHDYVVDREMGVETQFQTIMDAAKVANLTGGGSLQAAAAWCAPSEIDYGFCELETTEGLIDVPEVTARRGGISFTKGPDFSTLFADSNFGFIQTEAQVEGGTVKPCYAVTCPPFTEVRLDAIGFCITAGLLTNSAYPELVRRVLNLAGVGHARRKSASTIARIGAAISQTVDWTEVGTTPGTSATADVMDAVELTALRIRQSLAMSPTAVIEGFAPYWLRPALRASLTRRLGLTEPFNVKDSDVDAWFLTRGIRLQYVYDYQMLTDTNTGSGVKFPDTVEITLYPAGAFVRLATGVINLDAVYDHDMLTKNTYTAAFMEEGIAVANTCGYGVKVQVALNYQGAAGFPAIGAGSGVTFAAA